MANLTEISIGTRKFFIFLIIALIAYLILKVSFGVAKQYWITTHPVLLPPPDVRFEKIPAPKFTKMIRSSSGLKFTLENIEGRLPETTDSAKIFVMPKKMPTLLAAERTKELVAKLGFTKEPENTNQTYYFFTDPADPLRTLEIDIVNMNFKLKYDYSQKPEIFENVIIRSKDQAVSQVKNFIQLNNLFDANILKGGITADLLTYNPEAKKLLPAASLSQAQAVRVNYFRENLNNLKILSAGFNQSYNYIIFTPSTSVSNQILEISYTFWPIAEDNFGTYPLKTSASAWQDLVDGYAGIIALGNNSPDNIIIRNIYLAYYDSEEPQSYLQPIFVFEGDRDFVAYLPAISSEWLE